MTTETANGYHTKNASDIAAGCAVLYCVSKNLFCNITVNDYVLKGINVFDKKRQR